MLSVVIPTFNREKDLGSCITSILKQNYKGFEIIVVDNGPSTDGTPDMMKTLAKKHSNITYLRTSRKGCIFARNLGIEKSRGDFILTTDDDVELLTPYSFDKLIETFKKHDIGVIGAIELRNPEKKIKSSPVDNNAGRISIYGNFNTAFGTLLGQPITDVDHVRSAFMAFRKTLFEKIGGFNEVYDAMGMGFRYETDFCLWAKKLGYRVVVNPELLVWHKGSPRSRGFARGRGKNYFYYANRNHTYFMLTHFWHEKKILYLLYDVFIGANRTPGIAKFAFSLLKNRPLREIYILPYIILGKFAGIAMYYKFKDNQNTVKRKLTRVE